MERVYPRTACDAKVVRDCRNAQEKDVYPCILTNVASRSSVRSTDFLLLIAFLPKGVTAGITTCTAFWCCHGEEEAMRQSALLPSVPHFRCTLKKVFVLIGHGSHHEVAAVLEEYFNHGFCPYM